MDNNRQEQPKEGLLQRLKPEKFKKLLLGMDRQKWLVVILLGILLLVIAMPVDHGDQGDGENGSQTVGSQGDGENGSEDSESYEERLEQRLEECIGQMEGVGEVEVMITLEDQGESVVAQDSSSTSRNTVRTQGEGETEDSRESSRDSTTVMAEDYPYETRKIQPEIRGVCVIAQGAGNDKIRVEIYQVVQALFSIDGHKISIVEMGSQEGT